MAFGRLVDLRIGKNPNDANAFQVSDLDVEFSVERSIYFDKGGSGEITIYNAGASLRESCCQHGVGVELRVGYEDDNTAPGAIFTGNVLVGFSSHSNGDWVTKLQVSSGRPVGSILEVTTVSSSHKAGTLLAEVIDATASVIGMGTAGVRLPNITLPNGFVHAGTASKAIEDLKSILEAHGYSLYCDNGQLVVYKHGVAGDYALLKLTPETGLLKVCKIEDATERARKINAGRKKNKVSAADTMGLIEFEALIISRLRPNAPVAIIAPEFSGSVLIESVKYAGDNQGKNWKATCKALYR